MQIEHSEGVDFVLSHLADESILKRIRMLRWLAGISVSEEQSAELTDMADGLETAQRRFEEFHFKFRQAMKNGGGPLTQD